jgi:hypothetical protein
LNAAASYSPGRTSRRTRGRARPILDEIATVSAIAIPRTRSIDAPPCNR